jgi:hypothetical protein
MHLDTSERAKTLAEQLTAFMDAHIYPNEAAVRAQIAEGDRWQPIPMIETLKPLARAAGLWNLFLPEREYGAGLTNSEYAPLCEIMGRSPVLPRRCSTARHRTPGTWRCWFATVRRTSGAGGSSRCSPADPLVLCSRAESPRPMRPISIEHRARGATT